MGNRTLDRIKDIEKKAELIVKQARDAAFLEIKKTHQRHLAELQALETEAKKEQENALLSAEERGREEAARINAQTEELVQEIKNKSQPNIEPARREILRCLS